MHLLTINVSYCSLLKHKQFVSNYHFLLVDDGGIAAASVTPAGDDVYITTIFHLDNLYLFIHHSPFSTCMPKLIRSLAHNMTV